MSDDHTLFGTGDYPRTGPLAILARLAYLWAALAIVLAVLMPPEHVPNFVYSHNLQHFAAFYVLMLCGAAALPNLYLQPLTVLHLAFATVLEAFHLFAGAPQQAVFEAWAADVGGIFAALAPMVVERFRRRLSRLAASAPACRGDQSG